MTLKRKFSGASELRTNIGRASDGIKNMSVESFECGEGFSGQHIENLINSGGSLTTVAPPEVISENAIKNYQLENLLYSFGPNSTAGTDTFYCSGSGTQSNVYSGTTLVKKTFSFSNTDGTDDYTFFTVSLNAGTYMLHIDLGTVKQNRKIGIKFMDYDESVISYTEADEEPHGGKYYADVTFTAGSSAAYNIGFAPVYGDGSSYSISVDKLYLFNKSAAASAGCAESTLRAAAFSGRYDAVEAAFEFSGESVGASYADSENEYFTVGTDIFRKDGGDRVYLVGNNALDYNAGAFYKYDGDIFLTDGTRIISVSDSSAVEEARVPLCVKNCKYDASEYDEWERVNVLSPYIDVHFLMSYELTRKIPEIYLTDGTCTVTLSDGTVLGASDYTVAVNGGVTVITLSSSRSYAMTVRVKLAGGASASQVTHGNSAEMRSAFYGAKKLISLGSESNGDENVLSYYNDKIFKFKMSGGAYIAQEYISASAGSAITAMLPYEEGYFVFARDFIKRLVIDESTGALTLLPFKNDFGCDMPQSAVSERDKIIFANSRLGVYFIDRYGITEKDVSRRASANIDALLRAHGDTELKAAKAACAGGKYYLFVGGSAYVWNWYKKIPSVSQTEVDEKKLVWYVFSGIEAESLMAPKKSKLYFFGPDGIGRFSCESAVSGGMDGKYTSGTLYPVDRFTEKVLSEISISAKLNGDAELVLYCDGVRLPDEYTLRATETETVYHLRLPLRRFFGVGIEMRGDAMTLSGIRIKYYTAQ